MNKNNAVSLRKKIEYHNNSGDGICGLCFGIYCLVLGHKNFSSLESVLKALV